MAMEYQITVRQPYPGDKQSIGYPCSPMERFTVLCLDDRGDAFQIMDHLADFKVEIMQTLIDKKDFNLGHWYATKRARLLSLPKPSTRAYPAFRKDPCCLVLLHLLRNGINSHFPNVKSDTEVDDRFCVRLKKDESSVCIIYDSDLDLTTEIE